jgi:hypothetical protein
MTAEGAGNLCSTISTGKPLRCGQLVLAFCTFCYYLENDIFSAFEYMFDVMSGMAP